MDNTNNFKRNENIKQDDFDLARKLCSLCINNIKCISQKLSFCKTCFDIIEIIKPGFKNE
jgi:hypothetical protein